MNSYEVGQVLFLIMSNKFSIVPAQVIEQIVRTTLEGTKTVYTVKIPGLEETLELDSFEGSVFKDIDAVRIYMIENAQKSIEGLISSCVEVANSEFGNFKKTPEIPSVDISSNQHLIEVDLGDGQVGRVNIEESISTEEESLKKKDSPPKRRRGRPRKKESNK